MVRKKEHIVSERIILKYGRQVSDWNKDAYDQQQTYLNVKLMNFLEKTSYPILITRIMKQHQSSVWMKLIKETNYLHNTKEQNKHNNH